MKPTLKQTYTFLFWLGVFFIPFNSYKGISFLGEYKQEGAIVFFLLSFLFFAIDVLFKDRLNIPSSNAVFQLLVLFVGWLFLTTALNGFSVADNYMKQTSGLSRFIRQIVSLIIALLIFVVSYNLILKMSLKKVFYQLRKVLLYSFVFVSVCGLLEILILIFNFKQLEPVFQLFNYFPFTENHLDTVFHRISSVSYEPPFLAIYLITVAGWMFSYIVTGKKWTRFYPTIFVFVLTFFSGSRTALIVVSFQFFVFIMALFTLSRKHRRLIEKILIVFISFSLLLIIINGKSLTNAIEKKMNSLNFKENLEENISNRSRFGIQYTSLLIFKENPFIGVGFGQQAYTAKTLYPSWATSKNYEFSLWYLNDNVKSFPPGFNMYTRLLAETGIIGFLLFLCLLGFLIYQSAKWIQSKEGIKKTLSIVLFISFIGFSINWLQFDSFRVFGFWICFAIFLRIHKQRKYA